jgi:hypothetical protein
MANGFAAGNGFLAAATGYSALKNTRTADKGTAIKILNNYPD